MKKALIVLIVIILLAAGGVAVFLATFNLDRFRPLAVQAAEKALGRPVKLGRLKLAWDGGLAVQALQFAVLESETAQAPPLIEVERVSALVRLQPLLRKEIEVASVVIERPTIRASRDANGQINLTGLAVAASPAAAPGAAGSPAAGGPPMKFEIESVRIEHGTVHWKDAAANPPVDVTLNQLDVAVKHIVLGQPMDFDVRAALAADRQNLKATGRITLPSGETPLAVNELQVQADGVPLEQFLPAGAVPVAVNSFSVSVPQLTPGQPTDVKLSAAVGSAQPNVTVSARITMPEGQTPLTADNVHVLVTDPPLQAFMPKGAQPIPVKSVDVTVPRYSPGQPLDVKLVAAVASDAPNVEFTGRVTLPAAPSSGSVQNMKLNVRQLNLSAVAPPPKAPNDPKVRGIISLALEGAMPTLDPSQAMRQLSARGRLQGQDIVIENLNVVREVINRLSLVPGLGERTRAKLPPEYQAKLDAKDTVLKPIDAPIAIEHGVLRAPDLVVRSDSFAVTGLGPVSLTPPVSTPVQIYLDPHLSAVLISSLNELQGLTTPAGELGLPAIVTDSPPYLALDVKYIASRLISNKLGDLLGDALGVERAQPQQAPRQPVPQQPVPGQQAPTQQPVQPAQPTQMNQQPQQPRQPTKEELIGNLLQQILQPPAAPDSSQRQ